MTPFGTAKLGTVLVVEDDEALRNIYWQALLLEGFQVISASDGVSALRVLEHTLPDVIVLDLGLPRLSGWQLHQELAGRSDLRNVPVVVVTGSDASLLVSQVAAVLIKPVPVANVVEQVRRARRIA